MLDIGNFAYIKIGIFADCHQMIFPDIFSIESFGAPIEPDV